MEIENISDTARWVAYYRAMETERPDAHFRDPFARRLAGDRGESITNAMKQGRAMAWAMIVRTAVMDEIILRTVTRDRVDTVVNLAAGLDARPWRLALPPSLRWVDVDLPGILDYKTGLMRDERPACSYEAIKADLTDAAVRRDVFQRLAAGAQRTLVIAEGLLIYLTEEQVGALASDLHAQPAFRWWLIDLASPRLLQFVNRSWGDSMARGNAVFRFGPASGTAFFAPFGWREVEFRSTGDEARRLHREMRYMWLWRLLARLGPAQRREEIRRMSGIVLLERT